MPIKRNITKNELLEVIDAKEQEIVNLKKEVENLEKYKQYDDSANEMYAMYVSFKNAGFEDHEAYELLKLMIQTAGAMNSNVKLGF